MQGTRDTIGRFGQSLGREPLIDPVRLPENRCVARRLIRSGSSFEAEIGYSRAVVDGEWVFVSGTTGFDYRTMTIPEGLPQQTEQCLRNIESALSEAGPPP